MPSVKDISFLISTRNNCNRLQLVIDNIRTFYPDNNIVIISDLSTDDTNKYLKYKCTTDHHLIIHTSEIRLNFSNAYNKAIDLCNTDLYCLFHDDTFLSENFLENLIKHITNKQDIIGFSTCEPPVFHSSSTLGKPIIDFGCSYNTLNLQGFYKYAKNHQTTYKNKSILFGGGFFTCGYISELRNVGGFDNLFFPHFGEDSDLMHRLTLTGHKFTLSLDSLVYHLPSSTSRFSDEYKNIYTMADHMGNRNFIRKWHTDWATIQSMNLQKIPYKKLKCKVKLQNPSVGILSFIEPYFDIIDTNTDLLNSYIKSESNNTKFNLLTKLNADDAVDFVCDINGNLNIKLDILNNLQYIISQSDEVGRFELDNLIIDIL